LKLARKNKGFSQRELSKHSGVSQQLISLLESGKNETTSEVFNLATALDVSSEWLGTGNGDMNANVGDNTTVTKEEKTFLQLLRSLTTKQKNDALAYFKEFEQQNRSLFDELSKLPINQGSSNLRFE
jgi:transcriptional regulator with XRE-family HTH domain